MRGGIDPILGDMLVELSIASLDKFHGVPVHEAPQRRSDDRPKEVAHAYKIPVSDAEIGRTTVVHAPAHPRVAAP